MEEKLENRASVSSSDISNTSDTSINERILDMTDQELKELGIVSGLDNDLYHKAYGLSCTNLKIMLRSPAHYHASILFPQRQLPRCSLVQPFTQQSSSLTSLTSSTWNCPNWIVAPKRARNFINSTLSLGKHFWTALQSLRCRR